MTLTSKKIFLVIIQLKTAFITEKKKLELINLMITIEVMMNKKKKLYKN